MSRGVSCQDLSRWDDGIGLGVAARHMLSVCGVCAVYGGRTLPVPALNRTVLYSVLLKLECTYSSSHHLPLSPPRPAPRVSAWSSPQTLSGLSPLSFLFGQSPGRIHPIPSQLRQTALHRSPIPHTVTLPHLSLWAGWLAGNEPIMQCTSAWARGVAQIDC